MACKIERASEVYSGRTLVSFGLSIRLWKRTVELGDGILSVVTTDFAELFEDLCLLCRTGFAVPWIDGSEIFPFAFFPHIQPSFEG